MKKHLIVLLLFITSFSFLMQVQGQAHKGSKVKSKKEAVLETPPPPQEMMDAEKLKIVTIDTANHDRIVPDEMVLDFDTTAVPDDAFTKNIMRLMGATNAINLGANVAENMPQADQSEQMKEFYKRFIKDMREGTARRWLERLYVREYRKRFTFEEVETMLKFYESPLGKKMAKETSDMLPGIMDQGKKLGAYIGVRIYTQMMEEQKDH